MDAKYTQFLSREELPLLEFVMKKLDGISRSKAKSILAGGGVLVDHQMQTRHDFAVKPDMLVEISKHPGGTRFDFSQYFGVVCMKTKT